MEKRKIPGMYTCCVCGRDFPLVWEEQYVARNETPTGLAVLAGGSEPALYDAIDCPHCGCQNILQPRKRHDAMSELADLAVDGDEEGSEE